MNTIIAAMTITAATIAPSDLPLTDSGHIKITNSYEFISMCLDARANAVTDVDVVYAEDCLYDAVSEIVANGYWVAS